MIEKIYFAQELSNPTWLEYTTAFRNALANDDDIIAKFDVSEVKLASQYEFTLTLKNTLVSFRFLCGGSWISADDYKGYNGEAITVSGSPMGGGVYYHNRRTDIPIYKIITDNTLALTFTFDPPDNRDAFITGCSDIWHVDSGKKNTMIFSTFATSFWTFSEDITCINTNNSDKAGLYDNYILYPWIPKTSAGYICKDFYRYDGGRYLLGKRIWDIDGNNFVALSDAANVLLKCD